MWGWSAVVTESWTWRLFVRRSVATSSRLVCLCLCVCVTVGGKIKWRRRREKEIRSWLLIRVGLSLVAVRFVCMRSISEPSCSMLWLRRENYFSSRSRRRRRAGKACIGDSPPNTPNWNLCTIAALMFAGRLTAEAGGRPMDGVMRVGRWRVDRTINGACRRNERTMDWPSRLPVKRPPRRPRPVAHPLLLLAI